MKKDDLAKFYLTYKLQIFPALVAIASLFLIVFVIYPQTVKFLDNQKAIGELNKKSNFLETKVVALESYNVEDLSRKLGFVLAALPADKDFGNTLSLLQQQAAEFGFSINSITFANNADQPGNLGNFEVKLDIKGPKSTLQPMLNNLESASRLIRIKSIDISSSQAAQTFEVALSVEVLYSPLPQNFGDPDSPLPTLSQKDEQLIEKLAQVAEVPVGSSSAQLAPKGKSNPFE